MTTTDVTDTFKDLEAFYRSLHRFGLRLADVSTKFQQLVRSGSWPDREAGFAYDRNDPRDVLNRSIDITRSFEFLVAVTGAFSSGKSTLLNVLLSHPDLLPASAIPLTAVCTVIRYGDAPRAQVRYVSLGEAFERIRSFIERPFLKEFHDPGQISEAIERPENFVEDPAARRALSRFAALLARYDRITQQSISFEARAPYIAGGGVVSNPSGNGARLKYFVPTPVQEKEYLASGGDPDMWVTKEWLALIRDVTLWVDSPLLHNNIVFLDLPGLNCREDYHRRAIREYCNMADCIVVTAFQPGNQADEDIVQNFKRLSSNFRDKLFFVFNRIDQFQTEPEELSRSFDYLSRDCIGTDFPRDRCFLTSAYLAKERATDPGRFLENYRNFARAFEGFHSSIPSLDEKVAHATAADDPGGIEHFRECLQEFLSRDAYRTKIEEVLQNYDSALERLRNAASPHFEDLLRVDQRELLLRTALDYFRRIEQLARHAIYGFRYEYLRGTGESSATLSRDLRPVLEAAHKEIERAIIRYFNKPIPMAPPREEPVRPFDLLRIADDASVQLRRQFLDLLTAAVVDCVRQRFYEHLNRSKVREHVRNLFRGSPEWTERLARILERFELMLRHSMLCKVRERFYHMPGGRQLKRLERTVNLSDMKHLLINVFTEFYPAWVFQNVYTEVQDGLWLSFFLDAEELETELREFFESSQGHITSSEVLENAKIPKELSDGFNNIYEVAGVCRELRDLLEEAEELRTRNAASRSFEPLLAQV